LVLYNIITSD